MQKLSTGDSVIYVKNGYIFSSDKALKVLRKGDAFLCPTYI